MELTKTITSFDPVPAAPPRPARGATRRSGGGGLRATYDAAKWGDDNSRKHWANADNLSADAAGSPDVRARLRARSRYEVANNGYAKRLLARRTNDTVGTGARLQVEFPAAFTDPDFQRPVAPDEDLAGAVEARWDEWCRAVGLTDKVRLMALSEDESGEAFAVLVTNPALPGVRLDLRVYEADQCATPTLVLPEDDEADGIRFDAAGNPTAYHFLRRHPGDNAYAGLPSEGTWVSASRVLHLFERQRPGQTRGLPILTSALPLFAILRRYTLASLLTAEAQSRITVVLEKEHALADCDPGAEEEEDGGGQTVHFGGSEMLELSSGMKANTLNHTSPAPSYGEFKTEVLTETGGAAGAPRNVATGSSAEYNYSSGRLDHLPYQCDARIRRERFERHLYARVFRAWYDEARLVPGHLPDGLPPVEMWKLKWHWDGFPSIDPLKDAAACQLRKEIGLSTDAEELAREGKDWREHYQQLAREKAERVRLGIEPEPKPPAARSAEDEAAAAARHALRTHLLTDDREGVPGG